MRRGLRDGLGDVGGLASGLTMVDGRLADSLGRSEQGLSHRRVPATTRDLKQGDNPDLKLGKTRGQSLSFYAF